MQLSYFLPNRTAGHLHTAGLALLRDYGLADSLGDLRRLEELAWCEVNKGPSGDAGLVIAPLRAADDEPPELLGYHPEQQTWSDAFGDGALWVGMANDAPPIASDLRRRTPLYVGYEMTLADGSKWQVPVLRSPERPTSLHQRLKFSRDGQVLHVVAARYLDLWEQAGEVATALFHTGAATLQQVAAFCVTALGLNYRYGAAEQNTLGLVEAEQAVEIAESALDWPLVAKLQQLDDPQKKTEATAGSPATLPGSNGSHPITDPAAAS